MNEIKKDFKIGKMLRYFIFIFAFVCLGFTVESSRVEAAPEISIPTDDSFNYDSGLSFYVGYDVLTVNSVKYSFDNSTWTNIGDPNKNYTNIYNGGSASTLCSNVSFIDTCTEVIFEYHLDSLPNSKSNGVNDNGKFTLYVQASNKKGFLGGSSSANRTLTYDGDAPSISSVILDGVKKKVKTGDVLTFTVRLSEIVKVKTDSVTLNFKLNGGEYSAACNKNETYQDTIICTHMVVDGENGNAFTDFKISGGANVVDQYSNALGDVSVGNNLITSNDVVVDTARPYISSILASEGVFSTSKSIAVEVVFSETLKKVSGVNGNPDLKVKFGDGQVILCSFENVIGYKLLYNCVVGATDQGTMKFVSITGDNTFSDEIGNLIDLTVPDGYKNFNETVVDNDMPALEEVSVDASKCLDSKYCKTNDEIVIKFAFNRAVTFDNNDVKLYFDGKVANSNYRTSYDEGTHILTLVYAVVSGDSDGGLLVKYEFAVEGDNGLTSNLSGETTFDVVIDNCSPELSDLKIIANQEEVAGNVIYAKAGDDIAFNLQVKDSSSLTLHKEKVYFVDDNNNRIYLSDQSISSLDVIIEGQELTVKVRIAKEMKLSLKLKVEKDAIVDYIGNTLFEDYYSDEYEIDCNLPEFSLNVVYPEYKGYIDNGVWKLISGNQIQFVINSDQLDLKDYCIYVSEDSECGIYEDLVVGGVNTFVFNNTENQEYTFQVKVRDTSLNSSVSTIRFVFKNMFEYDNGIDTVKNMHSINVDISLLSIGDVFKYSWFKEGQSVNFDSSNISMRTSDSNTFKIDGSNTYNGKYRACIFIEKNNAVLCSEYVSFDTKIDAFNVDISSAWVNTSIYPEITFNDISAIKCIAIGKNISSLNCNNGGDNKTIYKTAQISNPFNKYEISENGKYYFYIEDMIGNFKKVDYLVNNIDTQQVEIEVFKDNSYNTNLEVESYKKQHSFFVTFDRNTDGSPLSEYKYFYSKNSHDITDKDSFEFYYLNSSYKNVVVGTCDDATIVTLNEMNGIYNLYIMAIDQAGNISFTSVKNIHVDTRGPQITMVDFDGNQTHGGSSTYITTFNYNIDIEESDSKLNLNDIYYKWIETHSNNEVMVKKYTGCSFDYDVCRIKGIDVEMDEGIFNPVYSYRFVVSVSDYAGNISSFISNSFKIDTTSPIVAFDLEDKWYRGSVVAKFSVSKLNNSGTLNTISYCLNDCFDEEEYDLTKFKNLSVNNPTTDTKQVTLSLKNGLNTLYVYANDVFGNIAYVSKEIYSDVEYSSVNVQNVNSSGLVDVSALAESIVSFSVNDNYSGISKYCIYKGNTSLRCEENVMAGSIDDQFTVSNNGDYYVEVNDVAGNVYKHNIKVIGAEKEAISFNLVSNVADGKFTNGSVLVSLTNMRKFMIDDASSLVKTIDYISVNEYESDYSDMFTSSVNVYDKDVSGSLVTSFSVTENKIYVVRVVDIYNNESYKTINITCIDKTAPFIDHDSDKVQVTTSSGNKIVKTGDASYKYGNETLVVKFAKSSLKDEYYGYNSYLAVKVCFDDGDECVYNAYSVNSIVSDTYVVNNNVVSISAPYHFNGNVRYYLVDGAGNQSAEYIINVSYVGAVQNIDVTITDTDSESIKTDVKYNKVIATLGSYNSEIDVKYALVDSSVDLNYEFANKISLDSFLTRYSFVAINQTTFEISKNSVDSSYYVWLYVCDTFNNYKLFNTGDLIRLDTKVPTFEEIGYSINKTDSSSYEVVVEKNIYDFYVDLNNDNVYEKVSFEDNKYNFTVSGVSSVKFKLKDSAGNESSELVVDLSSVSSGVYGRVYQNGNNREAIVVIYNAGNKTPSLFKYVVTNINNNDTFTDSTIDNIVYECVGDEVDCYKSVYTVKSKGMYSVTTTSDKKLVFYIYVDGNLVHDIKGNLLTIDLSKDSTKPVVTFSESNPLIISTINNKVYSFGLSVNEKNITNTNNIKYVFTKNTYVNDFNSVYDSCINSNDCIKGVYDLDSNMSGYININGNYPSLLTGTYYLYTYVEDDYGNFVIERSNSIYVDNSAPIISYKSGTNNYSAIENTLFATQAITLKLDDDTGIGYFEILDMNDSLVARCNINSTKADFNCDSGSYSELGDSILYDLDTGSYKVVVYDTSDNIKEVNISIDANAPVIELYKYVSGDYIKQPAGEKLYNSLDNLYLKVVESNFSYVAIDLYNTISGEIVENAVRYSYNSEMGKNIVNSVNGVLLKDVLVTNMEYNKIVIKAYDKSSRYSQLIINYDDVTPVIWVKDVGENIKIDGDFYEIKEGYLMDLEIGVNSSLTLNKVLGAFVVSVDNMSYNGAKDTGLLKVAVYKEVSSVYSAFEQNLFDYIGKYKIEIKYTDNAGNEAESKLLYINIEDNTDPTISFDGFDGVVELRENVNIPLVKASDNYGLDVDKTKEKLLGLEDAVCLLGGEDCLSFVDGTDGAYKFNRVGIYEFTFTVSDISSNSATFTFMLEVRDSRGPNMTSDDALSRVVYIGERNSAKPSVSVHYPSSRDVGDNSDSNVVYLGLFALNSSGGKYKVDNISYTDINKVITYNFTDIGTYYIRFASSDSNGNSSLFEYEVQVRDVISPIITGVKDGDVVELDLDLGTSYDINEIISKYNIQVSDNYDDAVELNKLRNGDEVTFSATDISGNTTSITIEVKLIDNEVPVVGSIKVDASTNKNEVYFDIVGGSDNSIDWHHEYSTDSNNWFVFEKGISKLVFGDGFSDVARLCIKAVDSRNTSEIVCQNIIVDTKKPEINGVKNGAISSKEVVIQVNDTNLNSVVIYKNGELYPTSTDELSYKINEKGNYYVEAQDLYGNKNSLSFVIDDSTYMNVVNDINASEYTVTSVDFDERLLVKVNTEYDANGNGKFTVDLSNIEVDTNTMLYILGVVPNTTSTFVIYSLNGNNVGEYSDIVLMANEGVFKEGVNNEDCFIKIGDSYYSYLVVKQVQNNSSVTTETNNVTEANDDSQFLKTILIVIASLITLVVGVQIIRLKRRVRAA